MAGNIDRLAEDKLILLFLLYQIDMPMTTKQLVDFAVGGEYMEYFDFQEYMAQLTEAGLVESASSEGTSSTTYSITPDGEETVRAFSAGIAYSVRDKIQQYVLDNKKRIKREFEVVANYFCKGDDDYIVRCSIYEDTDALMDISVAVVSKEQAKLIKRNWKENVTTLYGSILSALLDENLGKSMGDELAQTLEHGHVSTKYCIEEEE